MEEVDGLLKEINTNDDEERFVKTLMDKFYELKNNISNYNSKNLIYLQKKILDFKNQIEIFKNRSIFEKIRDKLFNRENFTNLKNFKSHFNKYSDFYIIFLFEAFEKCDKLWDIINISIIKEFIVDLIYRALNNICLLCVTIIGTIITNPILSLAFILVLGGVILSYYSYKTKEEELKHKTLYEKNFRELELTLIKTKELNNLSNNKISDGIKKIELILKNNTKLEKTIFLFLNKNQENTYFYEMLKSNFENINIEWEDDPFKIMKLRQKIKEIQFLSPFLIISSMKYFDMLNNTDIYDSMFMGLIIYTENKKKFERIYKDKNLNRINCLTEDPYTVFENAKKIIESKSESTYLFNLYYIASRFQLNTYQCLSAKILYFESLQKLSIFSIHEVLFTIGTSQRYNDFRNKFNIKMINKNILIEIFKNDLSEYYQLFKETLPEIFINYYFKYPINPLDKCYDILYSDIINKQIISPKKQLESPIKKEALAARADYLKILFDFMDILNKETNEKNKIVEILKLYTQDFYCRNINKYFSFMNFEIIEHFKDFLGIFYYCFLKFENTVAIPNKLYRAIGESKEEVEIIIKPYKIGDQIVFPQFVSTSISKEAVKQFGKILFIIDVDPNETSEKKPKNLSQISQFTQEKEYLFPCYSCFEILEIDDSKKNGFEYECKIKQFILSKSLF